VRSPLRRLALPILLLPVALAVVLSARTASSLGGGSTWVLSQAEARSTLERRVKAAFLYKFAGYVEWPNGAGAPADSSITFGVMADDGIADELAKLLRERPAEARPVSVIRLRAYEPLPRVHVLFIGHAESDRLGSVIRSAREQPALIVTDTEGALAQGSMINFVMSRGHVRFEVGLAAAQRSGLTLSSRLIAVAQFVSMRTP